MTTLLTKKEAAARVRVSDRTLGKIIRDDMTMPVTRIGGRVFIPAEGLDAWIARHADPARVVAEET